MAGKTSLRRTAVLLTVLVCVACVALAQASTVEERVAGLYANPEAIASLREGIVPEGWEDVLELKYDGRRYRSREGALEWQLLSDYTRLTLQKPLGEQPSFDLVLVHSDYHPQDTFFYFSGNGWLWATSIPPEDYAEALTEFVTLATFCAQPIDELTHNERLEREQGIETFFEWWQGKFPLLIETLLAEDNKKCLEADYREETYALDTWGEYERFRYALTKEQFRAVLDACVSLEPEDRPAFVTEYAATLDQPPERVLEINDKDHEYRLSTVYYDREFVLAHSYGGEYIPGVYMLQGQYDTFVAEWLPLSPAERTAPMREAYEMRAPGRK
ncbi:MAG: hypothetical protein FWD25_01560 [Clostridia bacterium]|nr:hypothetical protein [Clostridia bacterium]